jgi:tyrosinase
MSVNLGPVVGAVPNIPNNTLSSGLGYNPRCLRRDLNPYAAAVTTANYTYSLITKPQNKDIYWFQTNMQGQFELGEWGVHTGGHFTVGGDPGGVSCDLLYHCSV